MYQVPIFSNNLPGHDFTDYYPEPAGDDLVAPADFRPFFTLIEDTHTGEHYHPHVQYIFADDDPDAVTLSIIESSQGHDNADPDHRVILLDIQADGRTVQRAHCLNSSWHVSEAVVSQAPSWNEASPDSATQGMMLNITGQCQQPFTSNTDSSHEQMQDAILQMEHVISGYKEGLARLQATLEAHSPMDNYSMEES